MICFRAAEMELLMLAFGLPVTATISSRESPFARKRSRYKVAEGIVSRAFETEATASSSSILPAAEWLATNSSQSGNIVSFRAFLHKETQQFFVAATAHASTFRISSPRHLASQRRSSTSCTTSSGSPASPDARKNFRARASTLGGEKDLFCPFVGDNREWRGAEGRFCPAIGKKAKRPYL